MAQKRVSLETQPHTYEIDFGPDSGGLVALQFKPEVYGTEFVDAQQDLTAHQTEIRKMEDLRQQQAQADAALRQFLAMFMLPESASKFITVDDETGVVEAALDLPGWVLNDLTQWVIETYGRRPTGSSNGSAPPPPTGGTPSTAISPSKASTRKRGR